MSNLIRFFMRGDTAKNDLHAGPSGTITIDTTLNQLRVHDGSTLGGFVIPNRSVHDAIAFDLDNLQVEDINGLVNALDLKLAVSVLGAVNGVAQLDANGLIPESQLPAYINDVIEVDIEANLPAIGSAGVIYVVTSNGLLYRWTGSQYMMVSATIESTDVLPEGAVNLYYTPARARVAFSSSDSVIYDSENGIFTLDIPVKSVNGKTGDVIVDKVDIGLGLVDNFTTATLVQSLELTSINSFVTPNGVRNFFASIGVYEDASVWTWDSLELVGYLLDESGNLILDENGNPIQI